MEDTDSKLKNYENSKVLTVNVKFEQSVDMTGEVHDCVVCGNKTDENYHIFYTKTHCSQISLYVFLCKFTQADLSSKNGFSKAMCKYCYELVNVLDQAEIEYTKLKTNFESIINKNPIFIGDVADMQLVKNENVESNEYLDDDYDRGDNSDDEPLSFTKQRRHDKGKKTKKKINYIANSKKKTQRKHLKQKSTGDSSVECNECGVLMQSHARLADHMLTLHQELYVKHEPQPDISEEKHNSENGFDGEKSFKVEFEDDLEVEQPIEFLLGDLAAASQEKQKLLKREDKRVSRRSRGRKVKQKSVLKCEECNATYTSAVRLADHKLKHEGSKPPYICEICGANYKHKKACDVHIALHKGISDWKCEECNKLFPSKGALRRHNNIHTGKPMYQCDLCGKSFIHTSSFKMHKLVHSGVKPFSCELCGLALLTRSHLKRHKRVHSGEKRHECPVCGKRFSERYNLVAHTKSHEVSRPGQVGLPPLVMDISRRRTFRCQYCEQRFERRYMLERHSEAAHQRPLERPLPKPRNTMSKLLKAQAVASKLRQESARDDVEDSGAKEEGRRSVPPEEGPLVLTVNNDAAAAAGAEKPTGTEASSAASESWHAAYASYTHQYSST